MRDPTVFIVDDDPAVRQSLSRLMTSAGLRSETFASAGEFLDRYDPAAPGCLVLDIRMPGMTGVELLEYLASRNGRIPVIIITGHGNVPTAVRALKAGACEFLEKPFGSHALLHMVEKAVELDARRRETDRYHAEVTTRFAALTPREREVMDLVVAGEPNKVIATRLGLSQRTVEIHRAKVMRKMRADSLPDLVRLTLLNCPREALPSLAAKH